MPRYDYVCENCENSFSEFHSIKDRDLPLNEECSECKQKKIVRPIGTTNFIYNRTGALRTSDNFNSRLKEIKTNLKHIDNTINVR